MHIHPETKKVVDYPNTIGKRVALKWFSWQSLDKVQESIVAYKVIALVKLIDEEIHKYEGG